MRQRVPSSLKKDARSRGERLLAAQQDVHGRWQTGTDAALVLDLGDEPLVLRWERIEALSWDADASTVSVVATDGDRVVRHVVAFDGPGRLVALARERVDASILARARERVEGTRGHVTVVARRSPTRSGPVALSYVLDRGLTSEDAAVEQAIGRAAAAVRADLGQHPDGTPVEE